MDYSKKEYKPYIKNEAYDNKSNRVYFKDNKSTISDNERKQNVIGTNSFLSYN